VGVDVVLIAEVDAVPDEELALRLDEMPDNVSG
jgi:hypothetical protein